MSTIQLNKQKTMSNMYDLKTAPIITLKEFQKHDKMSDCWLQIEDMIFDVSEFMHKHPGGIKVMLSLGGRDGTFPFQMNHKKVVWRKYLSPLFIGYLEASAVVDIYKEKKYSPVPELTIPGYKPAVYDDLPATETTYESESSSDDDNSSESSGSDSERMSASVLAEYRKLWKRLDNDGYFVTDYSYYYRKAIVYTVLFLASVLTFHLSNVTDSLLLGCAAAFGLGMFWQQIAFVGHDLGHNGITHDTFWDAFIGFFIGNFLNGISVGWWKHTHNVHHIRTNDVEFDPDIQHLPVFAITKKYLSNVYSKFHDRVMEYDAFAQKVVKYQHFLFIPLIMMARLNLHAQSLIFVIWTSKKKS